MNRAAVGTWVVGDVEPGWAGQPKLRDRAQVGVEALRGAGCGHLELFADRRI